MFTNSLEHLVAEKMLAIRMNEYLFQYNEEVLSRKIERCEKVLAINKAIINAFKNKTDGKANFDN